jgi:hypothetical protein
VASPPGEVPEPAIKSEHKAQQPPLTGTPSVSKPNAENRRLQSLTTDEFFYFFLRMRKSEVKRIVSLLQTRYPQEGPEQVSQRLISSKSRLALLGGTLVSLPRLFPGIGQSLKLAGIVGATSLLTRMNLYLINEIALAFGEDIDDTARVMDMMAVVGATAVGTVAPGIVLQSLRLNPLLQLPTGALSSAGMTRFIGQAAIRHFRQKATTGEAERREELTAAVSI